MKKFFENKKNIALLSSFFTVLFLSAILLFKTNGADTTLVLYGNVDVRQVLLGFRVGGRVQSMPFEEGDFVTQGSLVASLDKVPQEEELAQAAARFLSIKTLLKQAKKDLERRQEVINSGAVSLENFDQARTNYKRLKADLAEAAALLASAKTRLGDTEIRAPADGTILTRVREPGSVVTVGEPVYTLTVESPVWVRTFIPEPDLGRIHPGMKVVVRTDSDTLPDYTGTIGFVSPVAEFTPKNVETTDLRTDLVYRLRVTVDNPDRYLKQGMPVTVEIPLNQEG